MIKCLTNTIETHSIYSETNNNGQRTINLVASKVLAEVNTLFP